jgi:glycerophosphoryl diester phosphodiesterase
MRSAPSRYGVCGSKLQESKGGPATVGGERPLLIAHAWGNTRERLTAGLAAPVDAIELDVWYRGGDIWVRHEARLGPLPVLIDKRMRGHRLPPFSIPLGRRWYARLDTKRLSLDAVIDTVSGARALLVDIKGVYHGRENADFARALVELIRHRNAEGWVTVCGQFWPVLDDVRKEGPGIDVRYSVEHVYQWEKFMRMVGEDQRVRKVCIEHRFLNEERVRFIEDQGVDIFCWTVDNPDEARRLVEAGADGIISNDLQLLADLRLRRETAVRGGEEVR